MPRVLIVADSAAERSGLQVLLARERRFQVVGAAADGLQAGQLIQELAPEVAVVALSSWELEEETLQELRAAGASSRDRKSRVPVVILTSQAAEPDDASQPPRGEALLPAEADPAQIAAAVCAVAAGLWVVHPNLGGKVTAGDEASMRARSGAPAVSASRAIGANPALTPRELEVLRMMADGLPNKAIAADLGITSHTVKFHIASILSKLDAESRTEAVTVGIRHGLILL